MSNFQKDLKKGKEGEAAFLALYPDALEATDGREGDFIVKATGALGEIKSDNYCPVKYPNFIMERYRSGTKPGGPWQAAEHGCTYYVYQFVKTGATYMFNVADLVKRLESMELTEHKVGNGSYETTYYKVLRTALEDLYLDVHTTFLPPVLNLPSPLITCDNNAYHSNRTHLSSSSLKQLLKSPEQFYVEWVLGQKAEEVENPNFTEGSFVHTLLLEPELVDQYAIFPGLRKAGAAWEEFKALNPSKTILSAAQVRRCEQLYQGYASLPIAVEMLQGGFSEHTMLADILGVPVKTRADYINVSKGYIVDVKTTAAPTDLECFKATVAQYSYELSASLYCEAARANYGKLFDFYWLVLSKNDGRCAVYKASTETLSLGTALYTQAIVLYKVCKESGVWRKEQPTLAFNAKYEIEEI